MQGQVDAAARTTISIWGMFEHSDIFMKILMIAMVLASIWSWAIIFNKIKTFRRVKEQSKSFESKFWSGSSLDALYEKVGNRPTSPLAAIFASAMKEWKRSASRKELKNKGVNVQERIDKVMQITIDREAESLETHMIFLASTGSVSPLLGLFGTVWGIMDSFHSIGLTQNTNIAAVAPGVAEALLTTAIGLIAAIPALIAYNKFSNDIDRITNRMETFSGELSAIISRQIEQVGSED